MATVDKLTEKKIVQSLANKLLQSNKFDIIHNTLKKLDVMHNNKQKLN